MGTGYHVVGYDGVFHSGLEMATARSVPPYAAGVPVLVVGVRVVFCESTGHSVVVLELYLFLI